MNSAPAIEGADAVASWFGHWPRFHDHYLVNAPAGPQAEGKLEIHAWVTKWDTTDPSGHFVRERHCLVLFELEEVESVELSEKTFPAIIFDLEFEQQASSGWMISWTSSYGAEGCVRARSVRAKVAPRQRECAE